MTPDYLAMEKAIPALREMASAYQIYCPTSIAPGAEEYQKRSALLVAADTLEETVRAFAGTIMPLSLLQLKEMSAKASDPQAESDSSGLWVWIECLQPEAFATVCNKVSAYYQISYDFTKGESLCCGYPGLGFCFDFCDYGTTWAAYAHRPSATGENACASRKLLALPCLVGDMLGYVTRLTNDSPLVYKELKITEISMEEDETWVNADEFVNPGRMSNILHATMQAERGSEPVVFEAFIATPLAKKNALEWVRESEGKT